MDAQFWRGLELKVRSHPWTKTSGIVCVIFSIGTLAFGRDALFFDAFDYPTGVIANEYAFWNPGDPNSIISTIWEMTSGTLFAASNAGWTGEPDAVGPNYNSSNGNNSCVFRLTTKRNDFGNVAVVVFILNQGLTSSASTPPVDWDGGHIFLRYQSEYNLYYASFNRRDNTVVIKKKIPGGPSNGGTYYDLSAYVPYTVPYNRGDW